MKELQLNDKLNFVEEPVEIMDHEIKQLKRSRIPIVKVRWNSKRGPEFTWEEELYAKFSKLHDVAVYYHFSISTFPLEIVIKSSSFILLLLPIKRHVVVELLKTELKLLGKIGQDIKVPQSGGPPRKIGDEAIHKELGDRMEWAATTASSLEAEQDSDNIR
ncbi:hypothetical protein Tco_0820738 [Tanacetum coccineum]|uniref:Reverse transcriptase domain-containing protein n=1 Tax=Tanacetum coccineum TaxID=301880 RepID=A0ABQ5ABZ1_9ASTR